VPATALVFSLCLDTRRPWQEVRSIGTAADSAGWHCIYVPDHFMPHDAGDRPRPVPVLEAWSCLTALAMLTRQVRVGTLVLGSTYRPRRCGCEYGWARARIGLARTALGVAVRSAATDDEKAAVRTVGQGFETWVTAVQMGLTDYSAGRHALAVAASVGPNRELRKTYGDSRWLEPRGTFVLEHWGTRHLLEWRPGRPRRRSSAAIQRLFSPELRLDDAEAADFLAPLPTGANGARHGVPLSSAVRPDRTTIAVIAYCRLRPSAPAPAQAQ
jgi:hypothetical protein